MKWGLGNGSRVPGTLILLVVVALVLILRAKLPVEEWLGPVRDWVGGFGASGAVVLGLGIMVATAFGMPGSVMAIAAGLALGMGIGMLPATLVYVGLGAAGGSDAKTPVVLVVVGLAATIALGIVARRILSEVMAA
jgi:uncharacterized membrane protein YdjX (TVP38/TMEM64 family)